jgi:P pilus assembly chaperone PapD
MLKPKKTPLPFISLFFLFFAIWVVKVEATQSPVGPPETVGSGISLSPARVELEMQPGTETTVVVNLDYHGIAGNSQPVRIVASLNDWTINRNGEVEFQKANTLPNSASPWLIYSPAETTVTPGNIHSIRVTISVPKDATAGDHLTALIIEQRPDTIKLNQNRRQMVVRYRMAAVFYIKVPQLTRRGSLENLRAEVHAGSVVVVPVLKNQGNSMIRPLSSVKVTDESGHLVAESIEKESIPVLGGSEMIQPVTIETVLPAGAYNVKYRVDFQDGSRPTEGITDLVIGDAITASNLNSAREAKTAKP